MPAQGISALPEKTTLDDDDDFVIVDSTVAALKKVDAVNAGINVNSTWTDDGTDVKTTDVPRNLDMQSGGFQDDNVSLRVLMGDFFDRSFLTDNQTVVGAPNEMKASFDEFPFNLHVLTDFEVQQLLNIDDTSIGSEQWVHISTIDQFLDVNSTVIFDKLSVTSANVAGGICLTDFSGNLSSSHLLPHVTVATTQTPNDSSQLIATTAFVEVQGADTNKFAQLDDVVGAYTTPFAFYQTASDVGQLDETTTLLTQPATDQFSISRGTSTFLAQASLTIVNTSSINQDLTTDGNAQFGRLQLNEQGGVEVLDMFAGNIQLENDFSIKFFDTTESGSSPFIKCDTSSDTILSNPGGSIVFDEETAMMVGGTPRLGDAALQITSTTSAFLLPRLTTTQRDLLTPVNGMEIYNTTANQRQIYQDSQWEAPVGVEEFKDLTDVSGAYTTQFALYATNANGDGLEESRLTVSTAWTDRLHFSMDHGILDVVNQLNFVAEDLTTDAVPFFNGLILEATTWGLILNRMVNSQRDELPETPGTMIYSSTDNKFEGVEQTLGFPAWKGFNTRSI